MLCPILWVTNVTREVNFPTFRSTAHVAYAEGSYWTRGGATLPTPRWGTTVDAAATGTRYWYDGAYLRLKNVELSLYIQEQLAEENGHQFLPRLYLNGDKILYMWTDMPDDREANYGTGSFGSGPSFHGTAKLNFGRT